MTSLKLVVDMPLRQASASPAMGHWGTSLPRFPAVCFLLHFAATKSQQSLVSNIFKILHTAVNRNS